jgi:hypothetical protein
MEIDKQEVFLKDLIDNLKQRISEKQDFFITKENQMYKKYYLVDRELLFS